MSDEEKEAIEYVKNIKNWWWDNTPNRVYAINKNDIEQFDIILNLIEKKSKEIEHQIEKRANQRNELAILNAKQIEFNKLVNTVNSYKGQFKRQQKEIEELKEENKKKSIVIIEYQDLYEKLVDKIKAKIEELENLSNKITMQPQIYPYIIEVLQSLIEEKE